jgi:arylsulfatase A-like enzyme
MTAPNVLLLLTDQQRYDVTAQSGPAVETPNVDRMADDGIWFSRAYTPTSICTSTRASLLTGLYPHSHGMLNNCHEADAIRTELPDGITTFGNRLAEHGYRNSYVGKWHVGRERTPADYGFENLGGDDGGHDSTDPEFRAHQRRHGVDPDRIELEETVSTTGDPELIAAKTPIPPEATWTYYLAERTIERIEEWSGSGGPFFHRTDFEGPHHPYVVPEPYASMYDPAEIDPWPSFDEDFSGKPRAHEQYRFYRGVDDFDWATWAEAVAKYFGFVTFIDHQIGRVLDALEENGPGDTVVVHTSDHGDFTGSHRQFNKGPLMYDYGINVPFLVRWPGRVDPGRTCEAFVRLHDLMPTFLDVCGAPIPDGLDARSLRPLLDGERPADWPDAVVSEYHGDEFGLYTQRMVRTDRYKYVFNSPDIDELYDLREDPAELENRIDHPDYEAVRRDLRDHLVEWMHETADPFRQWGQQALREVTDTRVRPAARASRR